jgi:hypothetical protein
VKAKSFTHEVGSDFPPRERVLREVPQRLLPARGLVHSWIFPACMPDRDKKRVIRAEYELTRNFIVAVLKSVL